MIADNSNQVLTPLVCAIVSLGFYGLDEVAEVLESPFGNDPNDIHLRRYARRLMIDLNLIYHGQHMETDVVFQSDDAVDFEGVLNAFDEKVTQGISDLSASSIEPDRERLSKVFAPARKTVKMDEEFYPKDAPGYTWTDNAVTRMSSNVRRGSRQSKTNP